MNFTTWDGSTKLYKLANDYNFKITQEEADLKQQSELMAASNIMILKHGL